MHKYTKLAWLKLANQLFQLKEFWQSNHKQRKTKMCTTENYFVLDPRGATVSDLIRLLFSSDLRNRRFIHSSEDRLEDNDPCKFRRRWIIFVSIVIQKLMILLRKPLYFFGFSLGFWFNLLYINGGFFMILPNLFKGMVFFWLSCD